MESINIVVLSGQLIQDATIRPDPKAAGVEHCSFTIVTYRSIGKGKEKELISEEHEIWLRNPGTIGKHLRKGKSVMIQGRIVPGAGILANSVHFPESRLKND